MLRVLLALVLLLVPSLAWGAGRVAILRPDASDALLSEAVTRLQAELMGAGFEVVVVAPANSGDVRNVLERSGEAAPPAATLALSRVAGQAAIDVWVSDRVSGKTLVRRVEAVASDELVPAALALRAVDLLRASLLETLPDQPPAAAVLPVAARPGFRPRIAAGVALGVLHSFSGLGPSVVPRLQLSRDLVPRVQLRAELAGPGFGPGVSSGAGTADVRQEAVMIGGVWRLTGHVLAPYLGVSLGGYHLRAQGRTPAPNVARSGDVWAFATLAGAGLQVRLGSRVALFGEVDGLFTFPGAAVDVGGFVVKAGRPSLLISLGPTLSF